MKGRSRHNLDIYCSVHSGMRHSDGVIFASEMRVYAIQLAWLSDIGGHVAMKVSVWDLYRDHIAITSQLSSNF